MAEQIYTTRKLRRQFFGFKVERPQAAPGKVLVLTGGGASIVLWPNQKPTAGEAAWNRYDTVIEIDTSKRDLAFTTPVPSLGGDFSFKLSFSASYCVSDPLRMLNEGFNNPDPKLERVIIESASRITEKFNIENAPGALAAVRDMVDKNRYTEKLPFELSAIHVKLEPDSQAREHSTKIRQQQLDAKLAQGELDLAAAQAELAKVRHSHERDKEYEATQHQIQMEKLREEHERELQQTRIQFYRDLMQGGKWDIMALQLEQNPGDAARVAQMIMQEEADQRQRGITILEKLVKEEIIREHHVKEFVADLIRQVRSSTLSFGVAASPQLPGDQSKPRQGTGASANAASEGAHAE